MASSDDLARMAPQGRADFKTLARSQCPLRRRQMLLLEARP
jgi:hypothetical protein